MKCNEKLLLENRTKQHAILLSGRSAVRIGSGTPEQMPQAVFCTVCGICFSLRLMLQFPFSIFRSVSGSYFFVSVNVDICPKVSFRRSMGSMNAAEIHGSHTPFSAV